KPSIYSGLVAALDPNNTGTLALVDANGNHLADTFLQTYANVKNFLKSNGGSPMATKLSIQLLTAELNVALTNVDPTTSVFVPGGDDPGHDADAVGDAAELAEQQRRHQPVGDHQHSGCPECLGRAAEQHEPRRHLPGGAQGHARRH